MASPTPSRLVSALSSTTPFVAPEELEARLCRPFRLRLGANESLFGASPLALEAMAEASRRGHLYCDPQALLLREAVADLHGADVDQVVVGAGIDDLIQLFCRAFADPGEAIVTTLGSYPTFEFGAKAAGARLVHVPYRNDRPDLYRLAHTAHAERARLVYLANPDNPSGYAFPKGEVETFRQALPETCLLLLDEAYGDYLDEVPAFEPGDPGVVRLRTFSKAHGMAGLRIGYAVGPADARTQVEKIRPHFGVNNVAQAGALASLRDPDHLANVVIQTREGRERLAQATASAGWDPLPSATNFVTVGVGDSGEADRLLQEFLGRGVFIRKPGLPPLDRCIRVTVGRREEVDAFIAELLEVAR